MPRKPSQTFTEKEMETMQIVWELGEATAKQIQEKLPGARHYNSVLTIIRVFWSLSLTLCLAAVNAASTLSLSP